MGKDIDIWLSANHFLASLSKIMLIELNGRVRVDETNSMYSQF